jgi:hypothetical protein
VIPFIPNLDWVGLNLFVSNCTLLAFGEKGIQLQGKLNVRICNIFLGIQFFIFVYLSPGHPSSLYIKTIIFTGLAKLRNWILYTAKWIKPHKIPIFYSLLPQRVTAMIYGVTQIDVTHWPVRSIPGRRKRFFPLLIVQTGSVAQPTSYTSPPLPGRKAQVELRKTMERVGMNSVSMKGAWI